MFYDQQKMKDDLYFEFASHKYYKQQIKKAKPRILKKIVSAMHHNEIRYHLSITNKA